MFFLMIIGAIVGSFLIMLIPDYYAVGIYDMGGFDRFLLALLGLAPAVIMVSLQCGKYDREADLDEGGPKFLTVTASIVLTLAVIFIEPYGPLSSAISFYLNIFPAIFFFYVLLFDWIFREKLEDHETFLRIGPALVCGIPLLLIIIASYILAPEGTLLPTAIPVPISDFVLPLPALFSALVLLLVLIVPTHSSAYSRPSSTQYAPSRIAGDFYHCSDRAMESYVKKVCREYGYWQLDFVSNKTIYLYGNPDVNLFWKCMYKSTGNAHFVDDGWWVKIS